MKTVIAALLFLLFFAPLAQATEEETDVQCPDGQVAVTFADGNTASVVCVDPGSGMQPTEGTVSEEVDPANYD